MSELSKDNREVAQPSHEISRPEPIRATEKEKDKLKPNEQGGRIDADSKSADTEKVAHPKLEGAQNTRDDRKNDCGLSENQQTAHKKLDSRASHTPQSPEQRNSEDQRALNQDAQRTNAQEGVTPRTSGDLKPKAEGEMQPKYVEDHKPEAKGEAQPKPVEDHKPKVEGEVQPKPVEDQRPKAEGEVQPKSVEDHKPEAKGEMQPKPVEDQKPKTEEEVRPKPVEDQKPRLREEDRQDTVDERRSSFPGESRDEQRDPTLTDQQKAILEDMRLKGEIDTPESSQLIPKENKLHLPTERTGRFEGEPGNSLFVPSDPKAAERINQFGQPGVEYKNGYPDFKPFCTHDSPWGKQDTEVEIPHMTDQRQNPSYEYGRRPSGSAHDPRFDLGNFAQADNELRDKINNQNPEANVSSADIEKWRKDNGLVWHELPDGKTMQLVPQEIHDGCRHSGGVSNQRMIMGYGNYEPESTSELLERNVQNGNIRNPSNLPAIYQRAPLRSDLPSEGVTEGKIGDYPVQFANWSKEPGSAFSDPNDAKISRELPPGTYYRYGGPDGNYITKREPGQTLEDMYNGLAMPYEYDPSKWSAVVVSEPLKDVHIGTAGKQENFRENGGGWQAQLPHAIWEYPSNKLTMRPLHEEERW